MKCPFCQMNISQYISMGYDRIPELIKFEPENLTNHLRKKHSDNFIIIKKSTIDIDDKYCELVITKKLVL